MARAKFQVEVLTPEGEVFNEEVEMVSTRTEIGSIGVLANHTPLLSMLQPSELRLYRSEDDIVRFAQGEGYLQINKNHALILLEEALTPAEIDVAELKDKLNDATAALEQAEAGSENQKRLQRDSRRWQTFIDIAESSAA